ncbi:MAG: glycosyltransferase [Bacteroidales bacterium]|nr:glycosyltransferase [Bacteroidales bacterium]
MKLSIITVNLNNLTGLQKTIESAFSQLWQNFEFIIIDGASTDGSKEFLEKLSLIEIKPKPQIQLKWISEPDSGIFNAMNKGIGLATGEYLLFLNSGDFLVSENVLDNSIKENPFTTDFVCAKCAISNNGKIEFVTNPPEVFTFKDFFGTTLAHQSTFIKKELFNRFGPYREDLKLKGDWEFFVRTIILNKCTTANTNVILSNFNIQGQSANPSNKTLQVYEMKKIYEETVLNRFVPDYEYYTKCLADMKVYFWARRKKALNQLILALYKTARLFSSAKKNKNHNLQK